jgi:acyl carrier protein phosphodiesterase
LNYLAHLLLAEHDADGFLGALLGDRVKGNPDPGLAPGIRRGIVLHRRIDSYTDAHPVHRRSRRRFEAPRRRFAGVIVDVCYDHFLARDWERHAPGTLDAFADRVYRSIEGRRAMQSAAMRTLTGRMIERDWLRSYSDPASVSRALDAIAHRRLRDPAPLLGVGADIGGRYAALAADFAEFFPDLARHAARVRATLRRGETPG